MSDSSHHDLRYFTRRLKRHPLLRTALVWTQSAIGYLPSLARLATQELRQLPSLVIVGAQKAGTTQLYTHLLKHPRLFGACQKELEYFSKHHRRPLAWYRSQFPLAWRVSAVGGHSVDASPSYLCVPAALHRLHTALPQARVIAILRDPVSRAFSGYQHSKTRHRDKRTFADAVEAELWESVYRPRLGAALAADAPTMRRYVARGYYALQLELLLHLYPREQTLILDSADLFRDTNAACQWVFQFLGVESCNVQPEKIYNRGYYEEKIDPLVAERLREHYRPYDELLAHLLGRRFSWMKGASQAAAA
ncbi:MAG TPA: sulfotransferase domain-containing protein [Pirellulaceae bacterium]|nr:sulfotransferase domain-containing protein [Pirellulaceae bacterium]